MPDREPAADTLPSVHRDVADLLYKYGIGSVAVSLFASSGLAFISIGQIPSTLLGIWWLLITAILLLRGLDIFLRRFRISVSDNAIREVRRFGVGLIGVSILWAAFPVAFLGRLSQTGRAYTAIVLCGMVGGSVTVLSPSRGLSFAFCSFLVLPASVRFLFLEGSANKFLGILGCFFFVVMVASSRVAHRATMSSLQLARKNEALLLGMRSANRELAATQEELRDANRLLESRIQARTADLQSEMQRRERYARELWRANEDLKQFAFAASHDLQEPLRMITAYSQLLVRGYPGPLDDQAQVCLDFITRGAKQMRDLLSDLLSFAEAGVDRGKANEIIDLNRVIEDVKQNLKITIEENSAEIISRTLPKMEGERAHFVQLFQNLIGNAIKYRGEEPPRVLVVADEIDDSWRFSVTDNGMGIAPEYHAQIFGVFKRLHGQAIPGTGMGLAICQRVVERYQGRIWVESQPGEGAKFYFTIPRDGLMK
ncbi:MAG TPA: ATP-binding protein [Bryobacteraceae bacterium]|nr:ATP-binding protein [Bryobacteraceae bacterium]